ncbi:MAG: cytochrome-c oxidase, cbb3-type subunit II [Betaproteobacteria bacterium]|nr:cytochrome-c oxidase, cbb3-type subunit II [Betaproteobacteria bacterium]
MTPAKIHHFVENHAGALIGGVLFVAIWGGLAQILPVMLDTPEKNWQPQPYTSVQLAGREIYLRESCGLCHTQQVRPLVAEVRRYGPHSQAIEFIFDRPFLWGSKRTGPDLHRLAGKYSDEWHRVHLIDPRQVVPGSIMPSYPWLAEQTVDVNSVQRLMLALRTVGIEYSDDQIAAASSELAGMSEIDALIAYLQSLGSNLPPPAEAAHHH